MERKNEPGKLNSSPHVAEPRQQRGDYTAKERSSTYGARQRMLYFNRPMKRLIRPVTIIIISLLIALFSAAVTYTTKISGSNYSTTAALFLQTTPTPPVEKDHSVIGSTDGIVVMGAIIALIVLVPIIVQRKSWVRME